MNIAQKQKFLKNLKNILIFTLISGILLYSRAHILANYTLNWDWHLVDGQPKRTLHYCAGVATRYVENGRNIDVDRVQSGVSDMWAVWIAEAVDNWNKADTGWKFEPSELSFPPCQVLIVLADISEAVHGGGLATPKDTDGDGKADFTRIVIDTNLEQTKHRLPPDDDTTDGVFDGWSTEGEEMTRDPIGTLKHELSHAIRLEHHPDSKQSDTSDPDISDPRKPGDHKTDLSEEDIREARASAGQTAEQGNFTGSSRSNEFAFNNVSVYFEADTFSAPNNFRISTLSGTAIPDPLALSGGYSHIVDNSVVSFNTELPILKPLTFSILYNDEDLLGGDGKYIGDYDEIVPPALDEGALAVFRYIDEPFGVEMEGTPHWEKSGTTVDTENNIVTFTTTEPGIYGLSAKPKPGQTTIDYIIAQAQEELEPEEETAPMETGEGKEAPATGVAEEGTEGGIEEEAPTRGTWQYVGIGMLAVVVIIVIILELKKRRKKESSI